MLGQMAARDMRGIFVQKFPSSPGFGASLSLETSNKYSMSFYYPTYVYMNLGPILTVQLRAFNFVQIAIIYFLYLMFFHIYC